MSDFPQIRDLPTDVQYNIWSALLQAPRVHFLDLFGVLDLRPGIWQLLSEQIQPCGPFQEALPEGIRDLEPQQASGRQSLVKITTPQVYRARWALSGYAKAWTKPQNLGDEVDGVHKAVEQARESGLSQIPGVFRDLVGEQSPVSLEINGERDVVYLSTPLKPPRVYTPTDGWGDTWRSLKREILSHEHRQNIGHNDPNSGIPYGPVEQLQHIHHLIIPFRSSEHYRSCCGCGKMTEHGRLLLYNSRERNERRAARASGRPHDAVPGTPNVKCTMCRQVREQPGPLTPATREALLANRRRDMQRQVYRFFLEKNLHLDGGEERIPIGTQNEARYGDDVSVCSDDIAQDDAYGWYNNSRQKLLVDLRKFWDGGRDKIPPQYVDMSGGEEAGGAAGGGGADPDNPPSMLPPLGPNNYHTDVEKLLLQTPTPWNWVVPHHGTHPHCTITSVHSSMHRVLPMAFCGVETVYLFDFTLTLKPEITQLPSQGRRWYIKPRPKPGNDGDDAGQSGSTPDLDRGVFIEVLDEDLVAYNSIWMFEDNIIISTSGDSEMGESDEERLRLLPKLEFRLPLDAPAWEPPDGVPGYDGYVEAGDEDDDPEGPLLEGMLSDLWPMFNPTSVVDYARFLREWWAREFADEAAETGGTPRKIEVRLVAYLALDEDNKVDYERRKKAATVWGASI
ncbi:uncharacterized protein C8A04DRAFT_31919 [Dichotomopilus funicola]|uniref:Uncharacterized protein n=1 Tax=Dichotomopilus funicola TaxID=1934379 RepID=A0AAN6UWM5_9PEZI|nr:hypothetical protein C8A04DRAFT_31919 [Dichotomopilus funicola]